MIRIFNESFEAFKTRRTEANKALKNKLKGKLLWHSAGSFVPVKPGSEEAKVKHGRGTYIKANHGALA